MKPLPQGLSRSARLAAAKAIKALRPHCAVVRHVPYPPFNVVRLIVVPKSSPMRVAVALALVADGEVNVDKHDRWVCRIHHVSVTVRLGELDDLPKRISQRGRR